jgi:hypothetical protein
VICDLALSLHSTVSPHGKTESVKIRIEKSNQKFFIVANVILLNYKFSFLQDFLGGLCSSRVSYNNGGFAKGFAFAKPEMGEVPVDGANLTREGDFAPSVGALRSLGLNLPELQIFTDRKSTKFRLNSKP